MKTRILLMLCLLGQLAQANMKQNDFQSAGIGFSAPNVYDSANVGTPETGAIIFDTNDGIFKGNVGTPTSPNWSDFTAGGTSYPPTIQKFLSGSGTYTTPTSPAPLYIRVTMVGGGGGGSSTSNPGTAGVSSTFSIMTAGPGGGATPANSGSTGIGGSANLGGGSWIGLAISGSGGSNASNDTPGGAGGAGAFGGGGAGVYRGAGGAGAANSGGGGAGGGSASGVGAGYGGGSGGFVQGTINSPAATYSYTVGTGGAGGAAGSYSAGGAGGSGFILVEEFYQ